MYICFKKVKIWNLISNVLRDFTNDLHDWIYIWTLIFWTIKLPFKNSTFSINYSFKYFFFLLKRIFRFTIRWIHVSEHTRTPLLLSTQQWPSSSWPPPEFTVVTEMLCLLRSATSYVWLLVTRNVRDDVNGTPNCDFRLFLMSSKLNIQVGLEAALLDSTAKVRWSKPHFCFGHSCNFPVYQAQYKSWAWRPQPSPVDSGLQLLGLCIPALGSSLHPTSRPLFHPPGLDTNCSLHWETFFCSHTTLFFCSLFLDQGLPL